MNDENIKNKKEEKKKGFIAWLKDKLGFTPKGMGNVPDGIRSINLSNLGKMGTLAGRGGIGKSSSLFFGLIGGKGMLFTLGLVALAVGATLYYKNMDKNAVGNTDSFNRRTDNSYIPRILKEQQTGSTLDMFKEANRGLLKEDDELEAKYKNPESNESRDNIPIEPNLGFNDKDSLNLGISERKKLQTDMQFGLSTAFGSGSNNKLSAIGGFGNHMGKFGPSVGSGFSKNELLKKASGGKISSMSNQKRPLIAKSPTLKSMKGSKAAFNQAKAIKRMVTQPNYGSADVARHTLDKAWEGTTGSDNVGLPSGGSGIGSEGGGIVQTPSTLDNIGENVGGGGYNDRVPDIPGMKFDTPWASLIQKAIMFLMISALLAGIASMVANIKPWGMIVAIGLALAAVAMAVMVIMIGFQLMKVFGQNKLGMIYVIGGGLAIAAAIAAVAGVWISWAGLVAKILAASAGIVAMFASMASGPAMQEHMKKQMQEQTTFEQQQKKQTNEQQEKQTNLEQENTSYYYSSYNRMLG